MVSPMLANLLPTCLMTTLPIQSPLTPYSHALHSSSSPDLGRSRSLKPPYPDCDIARVQRPPVEASRPLPRPSLISGLTRLLSFFRAKKNFSKNRETKIHPNEPPFPSCWEPDFPATVTVSSVANPRLARTLRNERSRPSFTLSPRHSKPLHTSLSLIRGSSPDLGYMNAVKKRQPHRTQEHRTTLRRQCSLGTLSQGHQEPQLPVESLRFPFPPMSKKGSSMCRSESTKLARASKSTRDLLPSRTSNISLNAHYLDTSPASIVTHSQAPNSTSPSRKVMLMDPSESMPNEVPDLERKLQSTAFLDRPHQIAVTGPRARTNSFQVPPRKQGHSLQIQPECAVAYSEHTLSQPLPPSNNIIGQKLGFSSAGEWSSREGSSVLTPKGLPAPTETHQSGLALRTRRAGRLTCHTLRSSLTEEEDTAVGDVDYDGQYFPHRSGSLARIPREPSLRPPVKNSGANLRISEQTVLTSNDFHGSTDEDLEAGDFEDCQYAFSHRPTPSLNQSERDPAPVFPLIVPTCHPRSWVVDKRNGETRRRGLPSLNFDPDPFSIENLFVNVENHLVLEPQYPQERARTFLHADRASTISETPSTLRPLLLDAFPSVPVRPSLVSGPTVATPNLLVLPATPDFGAQQAAIGRFSSSKPVHQRGKLEEECDTEYAISNEISLSGFTGADLSRSHSTSFISTCSSSNKSQEGMNLTNEDEKRTERLYRALNLRSYQGSSVFQNSREANYDGVQDDRIFEHHGTSGIRWEAIGYDMGYRKSLLKENLNESWRMTSGDGLEDKLVGMAL